MATTYRIRNYNPNTLQPSNDDIIQVPTGSSPSTTSSVTGVFHWKYDPDVNEGDLLTLDNGMQYNAPTDNIRLVTSSDDEYISVLPESLDVDTDIAGFSTPTDNLSLYNLDDISSAFGHPLIGYFNLNNADARQTNSLYRLLFDCVSAPETIRKSKFKHVFTGESILRHLIPRYTICSRQTSGHSVSFTQQGLFRITEFLAEGSLTLTTPSIGDETPISLASTDCKQYVLLQQGTSYTIRNVSDNVDYTLPTLDTDKVPLKITGQKDKIYAVYTDGKIYELTLDNLPSGSMGSYTASLATYRRVTSDDSEFISDLPSSINSSTTQSGFLNVEAEYTTNLTSYYGSIRAFSDIRLTQLSQYHASQRIVKLMANHINRAVLTCTNNATGDGRRVLLKIEALNPIQRSDPNFTPNCGDTGANSGAINGRFRITEFIVVEQDSEINHYIYDPTVSKGDVINLGGSGAITSTDLTLVSTIPSTGSISIVEDPTIPDDCDLTVGIITSGNVTTSGWGGTFGSVDTRLENSPVGTNSISSRINRRSF